MPSGTKLVFTVDALNLAEANVKALEIATAFFAPVQEGERIDLFATTCEVRRQASTAGGDLQYLEFRVDYVAWCIKREDDF